MNGFSETYESLRGQCTCVHEDREPVSEHALQCVWYEQRFEGARLKTVEGHRLRILSPGWWNHQEGPDFKGAQIEFNGRSVSGDVEIHLRAPAWVEHGHHLDARYDNVILHVVLHNEGTEIPLTTFSGRTLPTLVMKPRLAAEFFTQVRYDPEAPVCAQLGRCSALIPEYGTAALEHFLRIAGEWRVLNRSRQLRARMDSAGVDQAIYEAFMSACGFSHFKQHFEALARSLPYDRARQLARQDPLLLEAALLQLAGLLPGELPQGTSAVPHFARLRALRNEKLPTLRTLPLEWKRTGVRPNNYPERRLAGAALFLGRTASTGLGRALYNIWQMDCTSRQRRREFEALFPKSLGFWATHCTWIGKKLDRPAAVLGAGRIRSIIGNTFLCAGLAMARRDRDLQFEERVLEFFQRMPAEQENQIIRQMIPRLLGDASLKLDFRMQQGMLQMYQDWCEPNPSCRNCGLLSFLQQQAHALGTGAKAPTAPDAREKHGDKVD